MFHFLFRRKSNTRCFCSLKAVKYNSNIFVRNILINLIIKIINSNCLSILQHSEMDSCNYQNHQIVCIKRTHYFYSSKSMRKITILFTATNLNFHEFRFFTFLTAFSFCINFTQLLEVTTVKHVKTVL